MIYNSCGDRHCPTCSGAKRADWLDSTAELVLDGVDHFQVVFTLPSRLSSLALGNREAIYNLLFASAWSALRQVIESEQGYEPAAVMVLHTWNQKLEPHAHVHAVVPGGGPSLEGNRWRVAQRGGDPGSAGKYLVDAGQLRRVYREAFLEGLEKLWQRGELKLEGEYEPLQEPEAWQALVEELRECEWVSYIEPPPKGAGGAEDVLKYLARYLTGGPISDRRILSADEHEVTLLAREGKTAGGDSRQVPVRLSAVEFTRRWSLHVLPKGYTKTRRYGGWSNRRRDEYLERCARLLAETDAFLSPEATDFGPFPEASGDEPSSSPVCPHCGGETILQEVVEKPSWSAVMDSPSRPGWYAGALEAESLSGTL